MKPIQRGRTRREVLLAHLALLISFSLLLSACGGKNAAAGVPQNYSWPQVVRDALATSEGFLLRAQANHREECASACTLQGIRDARLCVRICNSINLAIDLRQASKNAMDLYCAGPGWYEDTAPCAAIPAQEAQARAAFAKFQSVYGEAQAALGGKP